MKGRGPVKLRASGKVATGQKLFVIGHPCGLPQKYAPGAEVRHNSVWAAKIPKPKGVRGKKR